MRNCYVKAKLVISCDVELDEEIKNRLLNVANVPFSDEDIANRMLYAFLNPKLEAFNEENKLVTGSWDFICDFDGKLKNFILEEE